ncbi:hypothetical protein Tco_0339424 [Tanacetum coccineum]
MARQCTQPKRPRNATWDPDGQAVQTIIPNNAAFQTEDLDTYDFDCDDVSNAKKGGGRGGREFRELRGAAGVGWKGWFLIANISNYGSDVISEDFKQTQVVDFTDNEIHSDSNIIPYSQYLQETQQENVQDTNLQAQQDSMILSVIEQMSEQMINHLALKEQVDSLEQNLSKQIKEKECLLQTFTVFKSESKEKEDKYMENEIDLEKKIKELDNILFKVGQSAQTVHMLTKPQAFYDNIHKQALGYQNPFHLKKAQRIKPTLYDGIVMSDKHVAMPVIDDEETLILEEKSRSKMSEKAKDPEIINKNISHKPIDYEKLNRLSEDFGKRFTPQQEMDAEQAFWLRISNPTSKPSDASPVKIEAPKELPKVSLVNESLKKLKFHLARFDNVVKIRTTPDARTEGEWGFEHTKAVFNNEIIPFLKSLKDIFNVFDRDLLNEIMEVQTVFNQMDAVVQQFSVDKQCLKIAKKELLLENDRLLQQIMSQEVLLTVMNSISMIGESVNMDENRKESCDLEHQDKDSTIYKLKGMIKSMREKSKDENVKYDYCEIETKNVELENKARGSNQDLESKRSRTRIVYSDDEDIADDLPNRGGNNTDESEKGSDEVSTAGAKKGTASEEVPIVSTAEVNLSTAGETVTYTRRSAEKRSRQDKGKAIMIESEPKKKSKKELEQERLSFAEAIRLEEQMNEEQRAQIARDEEIARQWDEEERQRAMAEAKSTKKIDWNDPSVIRYHTLKMKPKTVAQARKNMIKYLKNQGNYKISDFKGMSYNEIRPIFERVWDFNQHIEPMDSEHGSEKMKSPEKMKSAEKMEEEDVATQKEMKEVSKETGAKRKKSIPRKSTRKRQKMEEDAEKEELKGFLDIIPREEVPIEVESLSTKFPIVDWKTCVLTENFMYYQVFRGDGCSKNCKVLTEMLEDFDRQDVEELYRLV